MDDPPEEYLMVLDTGLIALKPGTFHIVGSPGDHMTRLLGKKTFINIAMFQDFVIKDPTVLDVWFHTHQRRRKSARF